MADPCDDTYSTCKSTSAIFRLAHSQLDTDQISALLQLMPSWAWRKGEPGERYRQAARLGLWALSTESAVPSRDLRRHLDWLIAALHDKRAILAELRAHGYEMDIFCLWTQLGGTGGPTLSPQNMRGLAALGLTISFEFWSEDEDDDEDEE